MFGRIIEELDGALGRVVSRTAPTRVFLNRYRDLMIGIVLNMTCNVESDDITDYMLKKDVVKQLARILVDSRHDWPTNGAALALLQYCHMALGNAALFLILEECDVYRIMNQFVGECRSTETKRHLYEAVTLMTMSRTKMESI